MTTVQRVATERYDPVYRRGREFYDEFRAKEYLEDGSQVGLDLNSYEIHVEIRGGASIDGPLIASLVVVPLDLSDGWFGYYQTDDETEAFERALRAGGFYVYVIDADGNRTVFREGLLTIKEMTDP